MWRGKEKKINAFIAKAIDYYQTQKIEFNNKEHCWQMRAMQAPSELLEGVNGHQRLVQDNASAVFQSWLLSAFNHRWNWAQSKGVQRSCLRRQCRYHLQVRDLSNRRLRLRFRGTRKIPKAYLYGLKRTCQKQKREKTTIRGRFTSSYCSKVCQEQEKLAEMDLNVATLSIRSQLRG